MLGRRVLGLSLTLCLLVAPPLPAAELDEVATLARTGAAELALEMMDRHQPALADDPVAWMRWERERLFLYRSRQRWHELDRRVRSYGEATPVEFSRWARTQQVQALLALAEGERARAVLRQLIWSEGTVAPDRLRQWRRLILESQLEAGEADAARTTLRRFRQDYSDDDAETRLIEARLYLQEGQGAEALRALEALPEDQHRPLRLLARLQHSSDAAGEVLSAAIELGFDNEAALADRYMAWAVAARAAAQTGNRSARVGALERGLSRREGQHRSDPMFRLDPDQLWEAYEAYGRQLGNEARILVGDDPMWFEQVESYWADDPVRARAMLSVIAFHSFEREARQRAHERLGASLANERFGPVLLHRLYLDSGRFADLDSVPRSIRYRLADQALADADIPLASRLLSGLTRPPESADPQEWGLRRARVLLLGGQREQGLLALEEVLLEAEDLAVDRFLQVVFDLQNMGEHEPALDFLMRLLALELTEQQHREILFWAAESAEGLGDPLEGARLYLRSAGFHDPFSMDQWAQTARYRAADALAEAGLVADARRLYQSLLNATDDEARRSVLRNRIQRLQTQLPDQDREPMQP